MKEQRLKRKNAVIFKYLENPNLTIDEISEILEYRRSTVSDILTKFHKLKSDLFVVASLCTAETFFVFNNINERELKVDSDNFVLNQNDFTFDERLILARKYGFKIR